MGPSSVQNASRSHIVVKIEKTAPARAGAQFSSSERSKIGPRLAQDGSQSVLKSVFSLLKTIIDLASFWDQFWAHFGFPRPVPFGHPFRTFSGASEALLWASWGPFGPSGGPQSPMSPGCPKSDFGAPRRSQGPPKGHHFGIIFETFSDKILVSIFETIFGPRDPLKTNHFRVIFWLEFKVGNDVSFCIKI